MTKRQKRFFSGIAGFLFGVGIFSHIPGEYGAVAVLFLIALACLGGSWHMKRSAMLCTALFFFGTTLGGVRVLMVENSFIDPSLEDVVGKSVLLFGRVVDISRRIGSDVVTVSVEKLSDKQKVLFTARVRLSLPRYTQVTYGDRVSVEGVLQNPEIIYGEGDRNDFDYPAYLRLSGIRYVMYQPKVSVINRGGKSFLQTLYSVRDSSILHIRHTVSEPSASFLAGMLLGDKTGLSKETIEDFRRSGLVHLLVLSGYNITLVALFFLAIGSFLPYTVRFIFASSGVILFSLMVGGGATVVRATVMALLVIVARMSARHVSITAVIALAGGVMVFVSPQILVFDASFQLSFLATIGLVYVAPLLRDRLKFLPEKWSIREIIGATISAQVMTAPLLIVLSGSFSLLALPANILVLPLVPIVMFIGFITLTFSYIITPIAFLFGGVTHGILTYVLFVGTTISRIPFSVITGIHISPISIAIFYAVVMATLWYAWRKNPPHDTEGHLPLS